MMRHVLGVRRSALSFASGQLGLGVASCPARRSDSNPRSLSTSACLIWNSSNSLFSSVIKKLEDASEGRLATLAFLSLWLLRFFDFSLGGGAGRGTSSWRALCYFSKTTLLFLTFHVFDQHFDFVQPPIQTGIAFLSPCHSPYPPLASHEPLSIYPWHISEGCTCMVSSQTGIRQNQEWQATACPKPSAGRKTKRVDDRVKRKSGGKAAWSSTSWLQVERYNVYFTTSRPEVSECHKTQGPHQKEELLFFGRWLRTIDVAIHRPSCSSLYWLY